MASKAPGDGKKKSSSSSAAKKKKDKPSTSSSKERSKNKSKDKTKSSAKKSKSAAPLPAAADAKSDGVLPTAPALPRSAVTPHDPDAVQLFRRYDRARAGVLTRLDFLQLLEDYANPPSALDGSGSTSDSPHQTAFSNARAAAFQRARKPLSLTDTSGIPLGYERSDKNSEFEAGQLFERYDKDRTGALTLDKFHEFFADFKPQLTAFVEDLNCYLIPHPAAETVPSGSPSTTKAVKPQGDSASLSSSANADSASEVNKKGEAEKKKTLKSRYQAALWNLRKLCKGELLEQRERILESMASIRDTVVAEQCGKSRSMQPDRRHPFEDRDLTHRSSQSALTRWTDYADSENQAGEMYEAMGEDLGRIDEIGACVRRHLKKASESSRGRNVRSFTNTVPVDGDVSSDEMKDFIIRASELHEQAQYLAMNDYAVPKRLAANLSKNESPSRQQRTSGDLSPTHSANSKTKKVAIDQRISPSKRSQTSSSSAMKNSELTQLLRVKDQMIYQLLLERTEIRKQKASMESYLQELSEVSTAEMKKWARLTDEMQVEIEHLRAQVSRKSVK